MRTARLVLIGLVILLVAAACGGGSTLTDEENLWCTDNFFMVMDVFEDLNPDLEPPAGLVTEAERLEELDLTSDQYTVRLVALMKKYVPSQYDLACKAAFADQ